MSVGGHTDTPVDLFTVGNVGGKCPFLGNGQSDLIRTPSQVVLVGCWSETIRGTVCDGLET